jgi:hypothetical protein
MKASDGAFHQSYNAHELGPTSQKQAAGAGSLPAVRWRHAMGVGAVVATGAASLVAATAVADAPRSARIVDGHSMAGVSLGAQIRLTPTGGAVRSGVPADWGRLRGGACFEGTNCSWDVAGGGTVEVILDARSSRVERIATRAPRWRTARGIGRGSTTVALQRAYGRRLVRRTTCGLNGFGGVSTGFVLNSRHGGERRFTYFALSPSRRSVSRVWIGRGRVPPGTVC